MHMLSLHLRGWPFQRGGSCTFLTLELSWWLDVVLHTWFRDHSTPTVVDFGKPTCRFRYKHLQRQSTRLRLSAIGRIMRCGLRLVMYTRLRSAGWGLDVTLRLLFLLVCVWGLAHRILHTRNAASAFRIRSHCCLTVLVVLQPPLARCIGLGASSLLRRVLQIHAA